jgi:hypothetical protein
VLLASGVAVAAVGLGLLLGLASSGTSRLVGPLRTFAFTAALTVALTHLLPEALQELGAAGLLVFAGASVLPAWGALLRSLLTGAAGEHGHGRAVLGAGYAGLLVHHVGDGLGLGAYSELPGGPAAHADVLLALAVHTVPLVAVVTLAFGSQRGTRAAVERALGLAAASIVGVLLSGSVPDDIAEAMMAWIAAAVAGLLMHVVTHDLGRDLPTTPGGRAVDFVAAALGVVSCTLSGEAELAEVQRMMGLALFWGAIAVPAAIAGLWLAASFAKHPRLSLALGKGPGTGRGLDGALAGLVLAGVKPALLFWIGSVLAGRISTLRSRLAQPQPEPEPLPRSPHTDVHVHLHPPPHERDATTERSFMELVIEATPWMIVGVVLFALLRAGLHDDALASLSAPAALGAAVLIGLPIELPSVTAVLIAVALWDRGLRADAALGFALMASAKASLRPWGVAVALLVGVGVGSGIIGATLEPPPLTRLPGYVGVLILAAAAGCVLARRGGLRGLFAKVFHSHDSA